jgi:ribonuclease M5
MNKIKINVPIIVEGKYDLIKLQSIIDGHIIKTDGFGIFKSEQTRERIKKMAEKNGIIVFTDSDGAGLVIRNHLKSILHSDKIFHIYPPQIHGKEKRKKSPSKEGFLGVEGLSADTIRLLFTPFENDTPLEEKRLVTKLDFFEDGLTGKAESKSKRLALQKMLGLPDNISANALLDTINFLYSYEEYKKFLKESEE